MFVTFFGVVLSCPCNDKLSVVHVCCMYVCSKLYNKTTFLIQVLNSVQKRKERKCQSFSMFLTRDVGRLVSNAVPRLPKCNEFIWWEPSYYVLRARFPSCDRTDVGKPGHSFVWNQSTHFRCFLFFILKSNERST